MNNNIDVICNSFALAFTVLQTEHIFQVTSLILTCISIAISLIFRIVETFKKWNETKDVTQEQVESLINETQKTINELKEKIREYENKE